MSEQDSWKGKTELESRICKGLLNIQMRCKGTNKSFQNDDQSLFIGHQKIIKATKVVYKFLSGH